MEIYRKCNFLHNVYQEDHHWLKSDSLNFNQQSMTIVSWNVTNCEARPGPGMACNVCGMIRDPPLPSLALEISCSAAHYTSYLFSPSNMDGGWWKMLYWPACWLVGMITGGISLSCHWTKESQCGKPSKPDSDLMTSILHQGEYTDF